MLDLDNEIRNLIQAAKTMKEEMRNERMNLIEKETALLAQMEESKETQLVDSIEDANPESVEVVLWKALYVEDLMDEINTSNVAEESRMKRQNSLLALLSSARKNMKQALNKKNEKHTSKK